MVHLPIIAGKKIYENNKVIFNGNKHVKLVERKIDEFVFEVKSGNYSFKIK
ncbi:hypothetical protein D3C86_2255730 [compost metagenome]